MKKLLLAGAIAGIAWGILVAVFRPSNRRDWSLDQAVLPSAEIRGPLVTIRNIRNFSYESEDRYTPAYYDRTFNLRKLDSAWFIVEPFGPPGAAHTFVSFGFGPDDYVAISVEIRKEKGESFSPLRGLLRQYEIMYVIGDERDLIGLRTKHRRDDVYLYPVRTTPELRRAMFLDMLARANELRTKPEFYNTLTNTCTTNIVRHVNRIRANRVPMRASIFLPSNADRLAYELGLIDTALPFDEARRRFFVTPRAVQDADLADFSRRIREVQ